MCIVTKKFDNWCEASSGNDLTHRWSFLEENFIITNTEETKFMEFKGAIILDENSYRSTQPISDTKIINTYIKYRGDLYIVKVQLLKLSGFNENTIVIAVDDNVLGLQKQHEKVANELNELPDNPDSSELESKIDQLERIRTELKTFTI